MKVIFRVDFQIKCCDVEELHHECYPIKDDHCWEYVRSSAATTTDCALGKA